MSRLAMANTRTLADTVKPNAAAASPTSIRVKKKKKNCPAVGLNPKIFIQ